MEHRDLQDLIDAPGSPSDAARITAVADLPTRFGIFRIVAFSDTRDEREHVAVVNGAVVGAERVPTRIHSECLTGDGLGSLRCDCRDQLTRALERLSSEPRGLLLYLRQEGRGIGLVNKIRAYALQDRGLDTVDANRALGFLDDERDYRVAARMIRGLGIRSVRLMTNNPDKLRQLAHYGVEVDGRIAHAMAPNEHNRSYLETKAARSGHWLDHGSRAEADGRTRADAGERLDRERLVVADRSRATNLAPDLIPG